jgi:cyclophilin family peptidyl-prolyl cis-trans isomerase
VIARSIIAICFQLIQSGDLIENNGTGGESIYGASFPAENFVGKHLKAGSVTTSHFSGENGNCDFLQARFP